MTFGVGTHVPYTDSIYVYNLLLDLAVPIMPGLEQVQ
jgi:hypothetical protein